jgi:hypothetical protein
MPAVILSTMVVHSNSGNTPSICIIILPAADDVSKGSVAERSATPARSSSSDMCASWRTFRDSRSTRSTSRSSYTPLAASASARRRPERSKVAPEAWSE